MACCCFHFRGFTDSLHYLPVVTIGLGAFPGIHKVWFNALQYAIHYLFNQFIISHKWINPSLFWITVGWLTVRFRWKGLLTAVIRVPWPWISSNQRTENCMPQHFISWSLSTSFFLPLVVGFRSTYVFSDGCVASYKAISLHSSVISELGQLQEMAAWKC